MTDKTLHQESHFTAEEYMKECEPFRASCVKCGIPMLNLYNEDYFKVNDFVCGHCGLIIYKSVLGEWKIGRMPIMEFSN